MITRRHWLVYVALYVVLAITAVLLEPIDDDWFFLRYFPQQASWNAGGYEWLMDNHWLPRDYWRPWEDCLLFFQAHHCPGTYPWLNHLIVVTLAMTCGVLAIHIGKKINLPAVATFWTVTAGMVATTAMGTMYSPDSLTMALSVFFGLSAVLVYLSRARLRLLWTILLGFMACLSKETGLVWLLAAPVLEVVRDCQRNDWQRLKELPWGKITRRTACCVLPVFLYLGTYYGLKQMQQRTMVVDTSHNELVNKQESALSVGELMTSSQQSHRLTPTTLVKNVFILYAAAIYPVDTCTIYYRNVPLLIASALLSISGIILLLRLLRGRRQWNRLVILGLLIAILLTSLPSLVTRAGEISPFASNFMVMLLIAYMVGHHRATRTDAVLLAIFLCSTLLTDAHKYSLAYEGSHLGKAMGERTAQLTGPAPGKVLWVGPDESSTDKAGAAFTRSPYRSYLHGYAAIKCYDYQYPRQLDMVLIDSPIYNAAAIDSVVRQQASRYDYIWISHDTIVQVIDCHQLVTP